MQLTSKDGNMVVDFYPVKFATGEIHNRLMLKVVTFMGKLNPSVTSTKKIFSMRLILVWGYGYQVTDESMIPQLFNSGMIVPAKMSLIKSYLHQLMTQMTDNIIDRDQLQDAILSRSWWHGHQRLWWQFFMITWVEFDKYSVDELIAEVEEYYPDLLEQNESKQTQNQLAGGITPAWFRPHLDPILLHMKKHKSISTPRTHQLFFSLSELYYEMLTGKWDAIQNGPPDTSDHLLMRLFFLQVCFSVLILVWVR